MTKKQVKQLAAEHILILAASDVPIRDRAIHALDLMVGARDGKGDCENIVSDIFNRLGQNPETESDEVTKMKQQLEEIFDQLKNTPLKPATFIKATNLDGGISSHALVATDKGDTIYLAIPNPDQVRSLKTGDRVMIDAHAKILVNPAQDRLHFGSEGRFERKVDDLHIEIVEQDRKRVVLAGHELIGQIDSGQVKPGAMVVCSSMDQIASFAIPDSDHLHHYRFLDRGPIPEVYADRDIGSPPKVIGEVARHVREEMTRPELRRKFRLRPCITRLLCGVSGTGKSLSIAAIHRLLYEIMAEITGMPVQELPPRVFRIRPSQMFSMWFGESDKNMDRAFDEIEQLADEPLEHKGKSYRAPVMVVLEEADGMGRTRGSQGNDVYDRVMTTMLQRLDPNRNSLANRFVVFLSTTNEPHIVDPAFLRRIGGAIERFGRLDQKGFGEVLRKHIAGLPAQDGREKDSDKIWKRHIAHIENQIYREDPGIIELRLQGQDAPVRKYQRDFMTGALIDRAVQQAASQAWEMAIGEEADAGIKAEQILQSLHHQVMGVISQLTPQNIHHYLDLPDGARVTGLRRVEQKA